MCYFCECFGLVIVVTQWPLDLEYIVSRVAEEKIKVGCVGFFSKGCGRQGECGEGESSCFLKYLHQI